MKAIVGVLVVWVALASFASGQEPRNGPFRSLVQTCIKEGPVGIGVQLTRILNNGRQCINSAQLTWPSNPDDVCRTSTDAAKCTKIFLPILHLCNKITKEEVEVMKQLLDRAVQYVCIVDGVRGEQDSESVQQKEDPVLDQGALDCLENATAEKSYMDCLSSSVGSSGTQCAQFSAANSCFLVHLRNNCREHLQLLLFFRTLFKQLENGPLCQPPATSQPNTTSKSASTHSGFVLVVLLCNLLLKL